MTKIVSYVIIDIKGCGLKMSNILAGILAFIIWIVLPFTFIFLFYKNNKKKKEIVSFVVAFNIHSIPELARLVHLKEEKTLKILSKIIANPDNIDLDNDAKRLRNAQINLQTMTITLQDKKNKKETWICSYCRAINSSKELTCNSCQAPKNKN